MRRLQVSKQPRLFVLDTPGILQPRLEDHHAAMSLGLIGEAASLGQPTHPALFQHEPLLPWPGYVVL